MNQGEKIVLVGGGQASATAILELRQNGYMGELMLISDEPYLPYERPPLSKDMLLDPENTKVEILSAQKLAEFNVTVKLNTQVKKIHPYEKLIELSNGEQVNYTKLLLATGATPRCLPILDKLGQHIYTLRNLEDAKRLMPLLKPEQHLLLVGGGVIGLELASTALAKGTTVTLIESGMGLMGRCAPKALSDFLLTKYRNAGVNIILNTQITDAVLENDKVTVTLIDGSQLSVDNVIYGIGVVPNSQLAIGAGLAVQNTILVNQYCQTSNEDIYAAGDVTSQLQADGSYKRLETWENANIQAKIFAHHVLGLAAPKTTPPWFWTDQLDMNIQFVGDMQAPEWKITPNVDISNEQLNAFTMYGIENDIIIAGITVNMSRQMRAIKKMVMNQQKFDETLLV